MGLSEMVPSFDTELVSSNDFLRIYLEELETFQHLYDLPLNSTDEEEGSSSNNNKGGLPTLDPCPYPELMRIFMFVRLAYGAALRLSVLLRQYMDDSEWFEDHGQKTPPMSRDEFFRQWSNKDTDLSADKELLYIHSLLAFVQSQEPLIADEMKRFAALHPDSVANWDRVNRPSIDLDAMAYIMQKADEMPEVINRRLHGYIGQEVYLFPALDESID
ncbi:uncharacterized protein PV06_05704 [Exophiala oligosperma]|uniref:Uncharacterized protein n=1 Tax=Exophiala oligosperma TaxID=215243 RepID=A0A0D2E2X0_9EURO|nr:uncharacterized protein PV06_05704 [Exophiala oligosperma]KIW42119.1 hypothetical protein PV06_05704 [Exophiala oligosperma]